MITNMEGPLFKWTNVMKGYQSRLFVLDQVNGLLSYYTSKEKLVKGDRRGCIRLKGAVLGIEDEDDTTFTITADSQIFHFKAQFAKERDKWVHCLEETILNHTHRNRPRYEFQSLIKLSSIEDFNKKLTEADSYLQILISQLKTLQDRIDHCSLDSEKASLNTIKEKFAYSIDSIKHAIVVLQIAKNVRYPINGVQHKEICSIRTESTSLSQPDQTKVDVLMTDEKTSLDESIKNIANSSNVINSIPKETLFSPTEVPDVSYASSDEDDFYDASEDNIETIDIMNLKNNSTIIANNNDQIDYDQMYDSDNEEDFGILQAHGSVISHLISQVKIGMDLTKVALPTFILERRSLLEMYADFFAHPDIFVSIPDFETAQERMVQVVKWYLSAFHAGRKGSIAKKPYNPVLGEIFKCHWNLSNNQSDAGCDDGPVARAKSGDLSFIAEQVSHHPPISAFYAESVDKRIMCMAHIWTKSKFLGLSIGVNNIGLGSIYLIEHGEEYTCTFPSAYGRSILTEPWFELGGSVEINCQQTGYSAKIEFLTKPFYGGKKHRISAEIFGPSPTKKLIVSITGEWNGQMHAKWANAGKSTPFVDTKTLPIIKKQVAPVSQQEEYESRNLWKIVTAALKQQDVNKATTGKYAIEQNQRNLVKEREEKSLKWENRAFHCLGDKWFYNNPLTNRK